MALIGVTDSSGNRSLHPSFFQQNSAGDIRLLGTDFSATITDLIDVHLGQQNSIPVFLSNLTLELFNRQSMSFG